MKKNLMLIERVEQRVLGALQLVDRVTQTPVMRAMNITAESATLVRNRRGYYVITQADGLETHSEAFTSPPAAPALEANEYHFVIEDMQKRYLPRLLTLRLPRDPDPNHRSNDNSLFRPQDVAMYPASTAPLSHNWSTVRVTVEQVGSSPVRGALIQIIDPAEDTLLASGISDERGEALVIVPGVPVTKFADEGDGGGGHGGGEPPVLVNTLAVRLELSLTPGSPWPVDPDLLEQNHVAHRRASKDLTLSTGRMEKVTINLI
jgi:hypothetical protein